MWAKMKVLPSRTLSQTLDLEKIRNYMSTVANVIKLRWTLSVIKWRRSSVASSLASLSHWTSIFVYNTMYVTYRVARVCLRQLTLVAATNNINTLQFTTRDTIQYIYVRSKADEKASLTYLARLTTKSAAMSIFCVFWHFHSPLTWSSTNITCSTEDLIQKPIWRSSLMSICSNQSIVWSLK